MKKFIQMMVVILALSLVSGCATYKTTRTAKTENGSVTETVERGVKIAGPGVDTNYDTNRKPARVRLVPVQPRRLTGNSMAYPPSAWGW
jgi:predicted component of type VI protein secretion system